MRQLSDIFRQEYCLVKIYFPTAGVRYLSMTPPGRAAGGIFTIIYVVRLLQICLHDKPAGIFHYHFAAVLYQGNIKGQDLKGAHRL